MFFPGTAKGYRPHPRKNRRSGRPVVRRRESAEGALGRLNRPRRTSKLRGLIDLELDDGRQAEAAHTCRYLAGPRVSQSAGWALNILVHLTPTANYRERCTPLRSEEPDMPQPPVVLPPRKCLLEPGQSRNRTRAPIVDHFEMPAATDRRFLFVRAGHTRVPRRPLRAHWCGTSRDHRSFSTWSRSSSGTAWE